MRRYRCAMIVVTAVATAGFVPVESIDAAPPATRDRQAAPTPKTRSAILQTMARKRITVQFDKTPVQQAVPHLSRIAGVSIVGRYADDVIGFGIDPDIEITLTATDEPVLSVLERLLEQCHDLGGIADDQCTWQLRRGVVEIGTKERLNRRPETRTYDLEDLLFQRPFLTNAPQLDLDAALNQGNNAGGGGSGGGFGGSGGTGGTGGGNIIVNIGDEPERPNRRDTADDWIELIEATVEPDVWTDTSVASIRYARGILIVRAPDYVHRGIAGYR